MSDANLVKLVYSKEPSFAAVPARTTRPTSIGFTKASLKKTNDTVTSETIRGDRQVQELIKVGVGAAGDLDFELVAGDYDQLIISCLQGAPVEATLDLSDAALNVAAQTVTSNGGDPVAGIVGARYVKIFNADVAGNNGIKRVVSIDANTNVITLAPGSIVADEASVADLGVACKYVRNGFVQLIDSYIFEERFISPTAFIATYGICVGGMTLDIKSKSKVTGKFSFLGYDGLNDTKSFFGGRASSTLTLTGQPADGETVTIGSKAYKFQTNLTNFDGNVKIGASAVGSLNNLIAAVNLDAGSGTAYAPAMTANPIATAALANVAATAVLTFTGNAANNETVVINGKTYTFKTALTNTNGFVLIGATTAETILNLIAAVNLGVGAGINYAAATTLNADAKAQTFTGTSVLFTAKVAGTAGNSLTSTEVITNATFAAGVFAGGSDKAAFTAIQAGISGNSIASTETLTNGSFATPLFINGQDPIAGSNNPIMNTTSNVGKVLENGVAIDSPVVSIMLAIANSLRTRFEVGNEGTDIPGSGDCAITGKVECYFKTVTQLLAFFQHAARSLEFPLTDGLGNLRNFFIPRIKYKDGAPAIDGLNTDIVLPLDFQAMVDPNLGFTIQVDMLDA